MRDVIVKNEEELFEVLRKHYNKNMMVLGNPYIQTIYLPDAGLFIKVAFPLTEEEFCEILSWIEVSKSLKY